MHSSIVIVGLFNSTCIISNRKISRLLEKEDTKEFDNRRNNRDKQERESKKKMNLIGGTEFKENYIKVEEDIKTKRYIERNCQRGESPSFSFYFTSSSCFMIRKIRVD